MTSTQWAPPHPATATVGPAEPPPVTTRHRRALLPTGWSKVLWCASLGAAVVASVSSIRVAVLCLGIALVVMMTWTAIAAVNVRRARPGTVYTTPPNPLWSALSWTIPLMLLAAAVRFTSWLEAVDVDAVDPSGLLAPSTAAVLALPLLAAAYVPFAVLGRATAWVGGTRRRWRQFYWGSTLGVVLAGLLGLPAVAAMDIEVSDGRVVVAGSGAVLGLLALVALPVMVTCWVGWRAMTELERAARMTWERRTFPEDSVDLGDEMVARAVAALYLRSHPGG